jgi:hypothetical protein
MQAAVGDRLHVHANIVGHPVGLEYSIWRGLRTAIIAG